MDYKNAIKFIEEFEQHLSEDELEYPIKIKFALEWLKSYARLSK